MSLDASSMSREDLLAELEDLREQNKVYEARLEAITTQLETIKTALVGSADDFYQYEFDAQNNVLERIHGHAERIETLEQDVDGRDKLEQIVSHAEREANDDGMAVMDYNIVKAVLDCSHQTAYNYMERWANQVDFVEIRHTPSGLKQLAVDTTLSNGFRKGQ